MTQVNEEAAELQPLKLMGKIIQREGEVTTLLYWTLQLVIISSVAFILVSAFLCQLDVYYKLFMHHTRYISHF